MALAAVSRAVPISRRTPQLVTSRLRKLTSLALSVAVIAAMFSLTIHTTIHHITTFPPSMTFKHSRKYLHSHDMLTRLNLEYASYGTLPTDPTTLAKLMLHFLADTPDARILCIVGFHTGPAKVALFFEETLPQQGLEAEEIFEMDADGRRRPWAAERDGGLEMSMSARNGLYWRVYSELHHSTCRSRSIIQPLWKHSVATLLPVLPPKVKLGYLTFPSNVKPPVLNQPFNSSSDQLQLVMRNLPPLLTNGSTFSL